MVNNEVDWKYLLESYHFKFRYPGVRLIGAVLQFQLLGHPLLDKNRAFTRVCAGALCFIIRQHKTSTCVSWQVVITHHVTFAQNMVYY